MPVTYMHKAKPSTTTGVSYLTSIGTPVCYSGAESKYSSLLECNKTVLNISINGLLVVRQSHASDWGQWIKSLQCY